MLCHKRPQEVARGAAGRNLEGFLRQHYTTSAREAGALAGYLRGCRGGAAPAAAEPAERPSNRRPALLQSRYRLRSRRLACLLIVRPSPPSRAGRLPLKIN